MCNDRMYLTPAYGRKYTNAQAAAKDFVNGKDFCYNGRYCSIRNWDGQEDIEIWSNGETFLLDRNYINETKIRIGA